MSCLLPSCSYFVNFGRSQLKPIPIIRQCGNRWPWPRVMHTGTNVWQKIKDCPTGIHNDCKSVSDQPWKHVPMNWRKIPPRESCTIYVTERNCDDWISRMNATSYELLLSNKSVVGFTLDSLGSRTGKQNLPFAAALRKKPIPPREMCDAHNTEHIRLQALTVVHILHFDNVCNQTNGPKADARHWLRRDSSKCVTKPANSRSGATQII